MELPSHSFLLLGMGGRRKLVYRRGELLDAGSGETLREWAVASERVTASEQRVDLETREAGAVSLWEDEEALWLEERGRRGALSEGRVSLPRFEGHGQADVLRALHHEMLVSIMPAGPVPNLLAYSRPWYRDAAMVCMCLEKTGNLHLVEEWILGLREPFDRNNGGDCEPDNLGQALYLASLVSDRSHPVVAEVLEALPAVTEGRHLAGPTDGGEHPVYQTKWLKLGLGRLGLADEYEIPEVFDSYSGLFWMDYREEHAVGPRFGREAVELYPYLGWAEAHFHGDAAPMDLLAGPCPMTWEARASQARYAGMGVVAPEYVERRICAPHTWHAAEAFLYLLEAEGERR